MNITHRSAPVLIG